MNLISKEIIDVVATLGKPDRTEYLSLPRPGVSYCTHSSYISPRNRFKNRLNNSNCYKFKNIYGILSVRMWPRGVVFASSGPCSNPHVSTK